METSPFFNSTNAIAPCISSFDISLLFPKNKNMLNYAVRSKLTLIRKKQAFPEIYHKLHQCVQRHYFKWDILYIITSSNSVYHGLFSSIMCYIMHYFKWDTPYIITSFESACHSLFYSLLCVMAKIYRVKVSTGRRWCDKV